MMRFFASLMFTSCLVPAAAQAQNVELEPTFGEVTLSAGFEEDPHTVAVVSGGDIGASHLGGDCAGFVANAPDVRLHYKAGDFPLLFTVLSEGDTTLVVNAPDGQWHCDDDSWGDGDPLLSFSEPESGQYDIWIGSFQPSDNLEALLGVSELEAMAGE